MVVERFFGRLKTKFDIMKNDYRGNRDEYSKFFKLCVALTNFDIFECGIPLSQNDSYFHERGYFLQKMILMIFFHQTLTKN